MLHVWKIPLKALVLMISVLRIRFGRYSRTLQQISSASSKPSWQINFRSILFFLLRGLKPSIHQDCNQSKDCLDPDQGQYQVPLVDPTSELHDPLAEAHWPVVRAVELAIIIFTPPALAGEAVGRLE
jgi:hypothetical protein